MLDPEIHAYRDDLADIALAGQLFAPHYARPVTRRCGSVAAPVYAAPTDASAIRFELQPDEEFAVLDLTDRWAWGYRRVDHRVGYVEARLLADGE